MTESSGQIDVFVENEAGSSIKRTYDPETGEVCATQSVSMAYPFAYGFVPNTMSGDGDCVDCFVVTNRRLESGETIACVPVYLLEQIEDGEVDHKILCVPAEQTSTIDAVQIDKIRSFISKVFAHVPGKNMQVGSIESVNFAWEYLHHCSRLPKGRA
ncbi:MAG: inorganic diphosphatase [Hyphomicrobiaceae bacterium]